MEHIIAAGDFKAKCLQMLDEVAEQREPLLITKQGKPVARLIRVSSEHTLFGAMAGSVLSRPIFWSRLISIGPLSREPCPAG